MDQIIDVTEIDTVFISYDEPQAEKHWLLLKRIAPWAHRIHGIKGSDSAHKEAAKKSRTNRVITVDGDNIVDLEFFNNQLLLDNMNFDHTFSWRSRNVINGLCYGNGGIKCWPIEFIMNMKTHESSLGDPATKIEFCWNGKYTQMHNHYSRTECNGSPYQAWRAGYREGIKLCLKNGNKPDRSNFLHEIHNKNLNLLRIWQTIGMDVNNGKFALMGARQGTYDLMLSDCDFSQVCDFSHLNELWKRYEDIDVMAHIEELGQQLKSGLGLLVPIFNEDQSRFFKEYYKIPNNKTFMTTEMEVIRGVEGW